MLLGNEMTAITPMIAYLQNDEKEALRALAHVRRTSISKVLRALVRAELAVTGNRTATGSRKIGNGITNGRVDPPHRRV